MKRQLICTILTMALLVSMLFVGGIQPMAAATATETVITPTANLDKVIATKDNLLVDAVCSERTLAYAAEPRVYNGAISDNIWNRKEAYMDGADGNYLWVTYTFSEPTEVDAVLVNGSGASRNGLDLGVDGFAVFVGDKDAAAIKAAGTRPDHEHDQIVKDAVRVDFAETLTGTYLVFRFGIHRDATWNGNVWLSEVAACNNRVDTGDKPLEPLDPTTGDANGVRGYATAISPGTNEDKVFTAEENLLKSATCSESSLTYSAVPEVYNGIINDNKWNRKEAYMDGADGKYLWITYTFSQPTVIGAVLVNGSGVERNSLGLGFQGFAVYAGDKDAAAIKADPTIRPLYSQKDVVKNAVRVNFSKAVTVTKLVFCLGIHRDTTWNGNVWISELAAAGGDAIAADTLTVTADNYADVAMKKTDNILKGATVTASAGTPGALLTDGKLSNITDDYGDGSVCWCPIAGSASGNVDYVYVSFALVDEYDVSALLFAGSGISPYGAERLEVYADKHFSALTAADEPFFTYESGVVYGLQVNLGVPVTTKMLTFKIYCRNNAGNYQCWISELGAAGKSAAVRREKIVCVGDSITYGFVFNTTTDWSGGQVEKHYPAQLQNLLLQQGNGVAYQVINAGISASAVIGADQVNPDTQQNFSGTASTWLVEQAKNDYVQEADKVLIMLGTNDAPVWADRATYYEEYYKKIVDAFRAKNPQVIIYVVTAPYTTATSHYAALKDSVVPLQKKMAASLGLPLIDVWEATRTFVEEENDGDLSAFIADTDMGNGLKVHPDEEGLAVIAKACFDALTGDENDLYMVKAEGAQLRGFEGTIPSGDQAVRFATTLPAEGITAGAGGQTALTAASRITIAGTSYPVVGMGTVVGRGDKLDNPAVQLVAGVPNDYAKDVPAKKLYDVAADSVTYTAVVTRVGEEYYDTDLVARGYVQYQDGDTTRYAYGPVVTRTAAEVIMKHMEKTYNVQHDVWRGFNRMAFEVEGVVCYLVAPHVAAEGNHWMWRTEFFDNSNAAVDTDVEMLEGGWYLGYCTVSNMYGNAESVRIMKAYYDVAVPLANLHRRAVMMGASRGGLYAVNYAATHPNTVDGLYLDAPVQDICSWPGDLHRQGLNVNPSSEWASCKRLLGFASDAEALADRSFSPKWRYDTLIENEIPVLLVYGDVDDVVPFEENARFLVDAYTEAGLTDILKVKCFEGRGHHPHGWPGGSSAYIMENMQ